MTCFKLFERVSRNLLVLGYPALTIRNNALMKSMFSFPRSSILINTDQINCDRMARVVDWTWDCSIWGWWGVSRNQVPKGASLRRYWTCKTRVALRPSLLLKYIPEKYASTRCAVCIDGSGCAPVFCNRVYDEVIFCKLYRVNTINFRDSLQGKTDRYEMEFYKWHSHQ